MAKVFDFIDRPFSPFRFNELRRISKLHEEPHPAHARYRNQECQRGQGGLGEDEDQPHHRYRYGNQALSGFKGWREDRHRDPRQLFAGAGIAKLSDNIRCVGIIDRYLEHSRILIFANGGKPRYFIGSADWMPRNLINRIEVLTPVYDEDMQADLLRTISYGMRDTMNGRVVDGKGGKEFVEGEPFRSQEELYKAYK